VYPFNDAWHALLNVFLAPAWGLEQGWSFNGPAWSISVEVLLYAGFFLLWRYSPAPLLLSALLIAVSLWVFPAQYKISLGVFGFFCGGLGYIAADWLLRRFDVRWVAAGLVLACGAGWWWCGGDAAQSPLVRFAVLFPLTIVAVAACHHGCSRWRAVCPGWGTSVSPPICCTFPCKLSRRCWPINFCLDAPFFISRGACCCFCGADR
jgi:peptidoglycan/LPS O-acetylase OafA/YrhL